MQKLISYLRRRDWDAVQSLWLLPAARRLYILGALGAVAFAVFALLIALVFQFLTFGSAPQARVPDSGQITVKPIDPTNLNALFEGPQRVRIDGVAVKRPVTEGAIVARLAADTPFGMARFPEGYVMVGGANQALFSEDDDPDNAGGTVLRARGKLPAILNSLPEGARTSPSAHVRILAKDANGNLAQPAMIRFRIPFDIAETPGAQPHSTETVEDASAPEALQATVAGLARLAGTPGSPEYFDAYDYAKAEPQRCEAKDDVAFFAAYVGAFAHLRDRLTKDNVQTFYHGLCEAWSGQLQAARLEAQQQDQARAAVVAKNVAAEMASSVWKGWARTVRDAALAFAIVCICFFMTVALFLAFLAIEGHSNAMRIAVEALARQRRDEADA
jgi:hypothetical protein